MKRTIAASLLLVVQLALVLSIAGKYLYERKTRPRVWVRTTQFDPNTPLRGRYLALQISVDACSLPHDKAHFTEGFRNPVTAERAPGWYRWSATLVAQDGHLTPRLEDNPRTSEGILSLTQSEDHPCNSVPVGEATEFFIPDTAKPPFPLQKGQELWVEVTVPAAGPPRPIQLALWGSDGFHPLRFD